LNQSSKRGQLPGYLDSVPRFMYFLLTSQPGSLDWFMSAWNQTTVIKVVDWVESKEFKWAVMLDLSSVGVMGESAMMPFCWSEEHDPTIFEAIYAWRIYAQDRKI